MIELLIVMAILAVLGTIAFIGMNAIIRQGLVNQTRTTLSNVASILAEYDAKTQLKRQPRHSWKGPPNAAAQPHDSSNDGSVDIWRDADPDTDDFQGLQAPGPVIQDAPAREGSAAVRNTQVVLNLAAGLPAARQMLTNLPPDQTMRLAADVPGTPLNEAAEPIVLDAWGNPIIFVPASGLRDVTLADQPDFVVTSVKVYPEAELPDDILAPNARPFFASAGPDGSFAVGDDNLYSFEK